MEDIDRNIAEVAIAVLMDRSRQGVASTDIGNGVYRVSYVRESDGILFTYDAKVVRTMKGKRVLWRMVEDGLTGRWRDDKRDEIIIPLVEKEAGMIRITIRQRGCRDVLGRESIK